jgi:hypothetical protein
MHTQTRMVPDAPSLLTVQAPEDIEYLVKESEVLTGRAGRTFVIAGADWLVYRVHWHPIRWPCRRRSSGSMHEGRVLSAQHLQPWEFLGAQPDRGPGRRPVVHPTGPPSADRGVLPPWRARPARGASGSACTHGACHADTGSNQRGRRAAQPALCLHRPLHARLRAVAERPPRRRDAHRDPLRRHGAGAAGGRRWPRPR